MVGAGPAGLMAATVAASAGASVLLLEGQSWAGGRLALQTQLLQGPMSIYQGYNGVDFCRMLLDDTQRAGVDVRLNSPVSDVMLSSEESPTFALTTKSGRISKTFSAKVVILATGSWEPWMEFPGSTLKGVMYSSDTQEQLNVHGKLPGKRVIMVGSDNAGLLISANLLGAGAEVLAVVDESPRALGRRVNVEPLRDAGVEILTSSKVISAQGNEEVASVTVASVDGDGNLVSSTERSFEVDTVCLAGPRTSESKLATLVGCPLGEHEIMGGPVPVHNVRMETPVPGLYVCGDAAGVENGATSLESGRLAGLWAAEGLGYSHPRADSMKKLARGRLGYLRRGRHGLQRRKARASLFAEYRRTVRLNRAELV